MIAPKGLKGSGSRVGWDPRIYNQQIPLTDDPRLFSPLIDLYSTFIFIAESGKRVFPRFRERSNEMFRNKAEKHTAAEHFSWPFF